MRIAAPLLALLVLCTGTIPAVAIADHGTAGPIPAASGPTPASVPAAASEHAATRTAARHALVGPSVARIEEPTVTELYIEPEPGGDARWTVSVRYNLSTSDDRAAFTEYGRTFEAGDADVGPDAEFFRTLAAEASSATGREMAIRNVSRTATVRNGTGVLALSFTWTNFVTDTDRGFVIREAVMMPENRTWLASIGPNQRLVVETPPGYQVTDTRFGLDNGSVVVEGPHTFREPLTISYQQTVTATPDPPDESTPWPLIGGALLAGLALVAAVVYVRRRRDESPSGAGDAGAGVTAEAGTGAGTDADTDGEGEPTPDADGPPDDGEASGADEDAGGDEDEDEAEDVDPALLSDEERVEHLLDRNGGRMKQARIVQETGWSDAKVSQLLSTMADDGRVEKLRLGRENLISLPDEEP